MHACSADSVDFRRCHPTQVTRLSLCRETVKKSCAMVPDIVVFIWMRADQQAIAKGMTG